MDGLEGVFVTQTPAVEETTRLVGDVRARIWAATSGTDGDVVVRLSVVTPGGRALLVADGARRGRFVASTAQATPLVPGLPVPFEIDLGPVALDLAPGQRLRVAVAPSSAPRYEPNPGSAAALADDPEPVAGTLTLFQDAVRPSSITLPIATSLPPWALPPPEKADDDLPESAKDPGALPDPGGLDEATPPQDAPPDTQDSSGNPACGKTSCALGTPTGRCPGGLGAGLLLLVALLARTVRVRRDPRVPL